MKADNRSIEDWLTDIRRGSIKLPRFQRKESWSYKHVEDFLRVVIRGNSPVGALLVLEVDPENPPFKTRSIAGVDGDDKCDQHLLDGQQRLTALWRALADNYEDRSYYICFEEVKGKYQLVEDGDERDQVLSFTKKSNNWIGDANKEFDRSLLPVRVLDPNSGSAIIEWVKYQAEHKEIDSFVLQQFITDIKNRIMKEQIPYLALPKATKDTDLEIAIDVFIKINTSFVKLKPFDIAVAQFEAENAESLQQYVDDLIVAVPEVERLEGEGEMGDLALKVFCVKQEMIPTYRNYRRLDMEEVERSWSALQTSLEWVAKVLHEQKIYQERTLPSRVPIRVLAALHPFVPTRGDDRAAAKRLIIHYLWRAFVTNWYGGQANSRLFKDYEALKEELETKRYELPQKPGTVFGCKLPSIAELMEEGWPTTKGIQRRAILAMSLLQGAPDIASAEIVSSRDIEQRQYHHIFPQKILRDAGLNPDFALNCMLIEPFSNRSWSDKWPGTYLLERIPAAKDLSPAKAEEILRERLTAHLIPVDCVLEATGGNKTELKQAYKRFLKARAKLVHEEMKELCGGSN